MRRNLIDAGRTCCSRLWTYLPPVCAFSVFLLLLILCCMKTLFLLVCSGVFCCFSLHPDFSLNMNVLALWVEHFSYLCLFLPVMYSDILMFPVFVCAPTNPRKSQCSSLMLGF